MLGTAMALNAFIQPDGCLSEKRDPCASPPCKRMKQANLPAECIIIDDSADLVENTSANQSSACNILPGDPKQVNECQPPQSNTQNMCAETENLMETESSSQEVTKNYNPSSSTDKLLENKSCAQNLSCANGSLTDGTEAVRNSDNKNHPSSKPATNHLHRSQSPKECSTLLKFFKPVSPSSKTSGADAEHSKTPSKDGYKTPSKDGNIVGESCAGVNTKSPGGDGLVIPVGVETPSPANVLSNDKTTPRRKTPGRKLSVEDKLKLEEERLKRQKEKEALEQERLEKKREKERAKEERQKERMEAKQKKEQERLEQLEQKKQREKERSEKKEKEEREKKERLEKKEEEKRKRDEEKRKKEEEEMLKKQKAKNSFASFFIKKEAASTQKPKEQVPKEAKFQPFELKPCMNLASAPFRKPLSEDDKRQLSKRLLEQGTIGLHDVKKELVALGEFARKMKLEEDKSKPNNTAEKDEDDDIMIIDGDLSPDLKTTETTTKNAINKIKGKLLQFHENYRPAYFGSWRKKSSSVRPRTPLKKDEDVLNYDVDSDDEWEEEEPGESLSNSEGEDEQDGCPNDDDEEQDGFFVPHGYLSDDEGDGNDEEAAMEHDGANPEKFSQNNPEDKMERHLAKQKTWEAELKRQFKPMKPVAIGCVWDGEIPAILKQLEGFCLLSEESIDPTCAKKDKQEAAVKISSPSTTTYYPTAMPVPEEAMPLLIRMIHGSEAGLKKLVRLFRKQWTLETKKEDHSVSEENWPSHCTVSKRQVEKKITSIANKELRSSLPKPRWYVHSNILAFYKQENIVLDGFASANSSEKLPSPATPRAKSPAILASFANVKNTFENINGERTQELAQTSTLHNTEVTSMDTTTPVKLE